MSIDSRSMTASPTEASHRSQSVLLGSILLYGTLGLLLFGPIAFGAVEPWSIFVLETGTAVLVMVWVAKQWIDGQVTVRPNPLFLPMAAFGLLILVQLVFRATAYVHDTISAALLYCTYGALCFLVGQSLFRTAQAKKLALLLCLYGSVLAAFALLQGIAPNGKLFWMRHARMGGWIYGPYVNHNHYAGLMELLIPFPLIVSLTHLAPSKERIAAASAAAVMAGTIFLSGSRGGMLALFVELVLLTGVLVKQRRNLQTAVGLGIFLLMVVGLLTWLGGSELTHRLATAKSAQGELAEDMRLQINKDGFHMFLQKPVLGWGAGSFPVVYPQFRTFYTNFYVNQAHDDYLQVLVETGVLGFGIMVWFVVVLYRKSFPKIPNWTSDITGAATLACIMGFTGILVHSAIDFNLQVPANAALFYVVCTVGASSPFLRPVRKRKPIHPETDEAFRAPASEVV